MKLAQSPKTFTLIFISFTFLIVQFGLVNRFLAFSDQDQLPNPETTQSIPDTYLPVVIDSTVEKSPAVASASTLPEPAVEFKSGSSIEPEATTPPDTIYLDELATDSQAEALLLEALPENNETAPPSDGALGGAVRVVQHDNDPEFESFVEEVTNGAADTVTGVYVADLIKLKVLQQPAQDVAFVSNEDGTATQFQSPALYGVIGLLAHNFLSGKHFFSLAPGQEIRIVYGSGSFRRYQVSAIADFERMTRFDIRSDFRDLKTNELLSSKDLFARYYREGNYLTLQTCLEGGGYSNWGVRMITAVPIDGEG